MYRSIIGLMLILISLGAQTVPISGQGTWETTLQARDADPNTPGIEAYYDTVLHITWLTNANLAHTQDFGVPPYVNGSMPWDKAQQWVGAMNNAEYLGVHNWRLPFVIDTDSPNDPDAQGNDGCNLNSLYGGGDCGYNVNLATGEMAHMYYSTLGNAGGYNTSGVPQPCGGSGPNYCLTNTGPFSNIQVTTYWSGTVYVPAPDRAWSFGFDAGYQNYTIRSISTPPFAWAVRDGDIDADGDEVAESQDNCTLVANPDQYDADGDGYGNWCDADLNNTGTVTVSDFTLLRNALNSNNANADLNHSGTVTVADYTILRNRLNTHPGPSGLCGPNPTAGNLCPPP